MIYNGLFALCLLTWSPLGAADSQDTLSKVLQQRLSSGTQQPLSAKGVPIKARAALQRFFVDREFQPAWTENTRRPLLDELMAAIEQADTHGLTSADYHQVALRQAIAAEDVLAVELLATDAYLTLAAHLVGGRLDPATIEPSWTVSRRKRDLVQHLETAFAQRRIAASLDQLEPDAPAYAVLKDELALYRQAAREGGWEAIAAGPALKLGDVGPRVAALRKRLWSTGLMEPVNLASDQFDLDLESAVAVFQRRIGIEADGVVGPVTLRELNKGPAERVAQLRANLERWRWLPEDLGSRHIWVNIADFRLEARRNGTIEHSRDVIVGRTYRKTPVFSDEISYVVLNPWWHTPDSLARQDKLPAFKKDPSMISRLGFQVLNRAGKPVDASRLKWADYSVGNFPFRLRQRPGPQNALGQVKLMFPNKHNIYLHDTPSVELFARSERTFSSGCIRVADAVGLSEWVLQGTPGWSRARIDATLAGGRETRVNLSAKVPVHILYFTAVSEPDGTLRLVNDVYDRDARVLAALNQRRSQRDHTRAYSGVQAIQQPAAF